MGVLNAIQTRVQPLRERRQSRIQSRKGDIFLRENDTEIIDHVRRFPASCARKFSFPGQFQKQYPLWWITSRPKVSIDLVQAVHKAYPEAIVGALHKAFEARQRNLDVLKYLLNETPDRSMARDHGRLPIHAALQNQARLDVIKFLVQEYPQCLRERDSNNQRLPIHIALEEYYGLPVIQYLVNQCKETLKLADYEIQGVLEEEGWLVHTGKFYQDPQCGLPLHTACKRKASLNIIQFLVNAHPLAISTKNRAGWLPLHFACAFGADPVVIEYLITACPGALLERTNCLFTEYPTHLAASRPHADLETLKLLVGKHPHSKPTSTTYASYMDGACHNEAHPIVIQFLRRVVSAAESGYSYLPTKEERFCAIHRDEDPKRENGASKKDDGADTRISLGQVGAGSG